MSEHSVLGSPENKHNREDHDNRDKHELERDANAHGKKNVPSLEEGSKDVNFYNQQDGARGRDGGPYGDEEEARAAETRRAAIEGREPDYKNPGVTAGQPLVTASQLAPEYPPHRQGAPDLAEAIDAHADDETFLANPAQTLSVDTRTESDQEAPVDGDPTPGYVSPEDSENSEETSPTVEGGSVTVPAAGTTEGITAN